MSDLGALVLKGAYPVSPNDSTNDPSGPFVALEATTGAGIVKVTMRDGSTASLYLVLGVPKYVAVVRVWSSVTAATNIIGYRGEPYTP